MFNTINSFQGQYRFLSNFYPSIVPYSCLHFSTVEHAYQAAKALNFETAARIQSARTPGEAKRIGQNIIMRQDWEQVKDQIMYQLVSRKFWSDNLLRTLLLETGDTILVEGNTWGDTYWGVCKGKGQNKLGEILMRVRKELQNAEVS